MFITADSISSFDFDFVHVESYKTYTSILILNQSKIVHVSFRLILIL